MTARPLVLAHRGACRQARENTVEAFRLARAAGADGVELDVRRTADGVLVVHHDSHVPGFGLLRGQPFAALRAAAPHVATLDEALDALDGMLVNLEVKCLRWEPDPDDDGAVLRATIDTVRRRRLHDRAVLSSFDLDVVDAARDLDRDLETGWLTMGQHPPDALPVAHAHGHRWLHPDRATMLGEVAFETAVAARRLGVRLDVWTVDDPAEWRTLADAGVDAFITDLPDEALSVLASISGK